MIRLTVLGLMMLVSLTAFSQKNTNSITTDSIVPLPKNVAKEIVKDLIRKDSIQAELNTCHDNQGLLEHNLMLKDSIILSKDAQLSLAQMKETNYETILQLRDAQIVNLNGLVEKLNNDIKKNRRKTIFKTVGNTALLGGLVYLLISIAR
jgi:hypothetical protein